MNNIGDVEKVEAISHLRVTASWNGTHPETNKRENAIYTPPPGWVIKETEVIVHSSSNGSRSVSIIGGGLNLVTEELLDSVYDEALEVAGRNNDKNLEGKLKEKRDFHSKEILKYSSNMNVIQAEVSASAHGSAVDRKRGWDEISVMADIMFLCPNDRGSLEKSIEHEFGIELGVTV